MSDTISRVKKVVAELLKIDVARINDDSRFIDDLGADSMQSVELVAAFEDEFDIELDEDVALKAKSVKSAAELIDKKLK